ncbi:MAG: zinc-ribbon domain-containing protein [Clostridia bacterium]|nr:zinc-ribbon domain-containing protein [Clostridia bacterium]
MFCKHCGTQMPESAKFCPTCGKINDVAEEVIAAQPAPQIEEAPISDYSDASNPVEEIVDVQPQATYFDPSAEPAFVPTSTPSFASQPAKKESGAGCLVFAILGLVFGCSFFLSIIGIVFSYIARGMLNGYVQRNGSTSGPASAAKGLSIAGLIVSWVMAGIFTFYFVILGLLLGLL